MICEEIFALTPDSTNIVIEDPDEHTLSYYDGRNSIEEHFNKMKVLKIRCGNVMVANIGVALILTVDYVPAVETKMSLAGLIVCAADHFDRKGYRAEIVGQNLVVRDGKGTMMFGMHRYYDDYIAGASVDTILSRLDAFANRS